jgi:CRISPR-associated protein Csx10
MAADTTTLQLPEEPRLRLEMLTDWHVGSGMGRPGNVDRLVVRDDDGLPYVPAKTLTGMWRDACERLAWGLDGGQPGPWAAWVKYLFGDQPARRGETDPTQFPRPAAVSVRSARLAESLRERIRGTDRHALTLQAALTFIKPGVKIDSRNGRALDEHLRFDEMARCGAELTAQFTAALPEDSAQSQAAVALLVASTRLVERLGGKRRRGAGRCKLEVEGVHSAAAVDWLTTHPDAPQLPPVVEPAAASGPEPTPGGSSEWVAVPFVLELHGPVNVSSRTVGNVVESLDFVPGTFLLRHFTAAFGRLGMDARAAIARGDLCVTPSTVEVDGHAGRPVPFALFTKKEGGSLSEPETVRNRLIQPESKDDPQYKQCRAGYLGHAQGVAMSPHQTVTMTVRTHNTVDEDKQRPATEVGGVYSYEAMGAQRLRGELRLRKELADRITAQPDWRKKLEGPCRLGRSKKDDYGSAILKLDLVDGQTAPVTPAHAYQGKRLFVWAVSDVLLRNDRLRPAVTVEDLQKALARKLDVTLSNPRSLARTRRVESWHVDWGLPRPSLVTLQAGSCVVFECDPLPSVAVLTQIETEGIGDRTAEGYGQVRFNDPILTTTPDQLAPPVKRDNSPTRTDSALPDTDRYAAQIEEQVWREQIRRAALHVAQEKRQELLGWGLIRNASSTPPMSQLGGLRSVVQQVRSWDDRRFVTNWLDHLAGNKRRADKWNGAIPKVKRFFDQQQAVWQTLDPSDWPTLTVGAAERLKRNLWPLAVRTLVDACIRAHKRELDRSGNRRP